MTDRPTAIPLDDLPVTAARLDHRGTITAVNTAWRAFAAANGYPGSGAGLGLNYIDVCDRAVGQSAGLAREVAEGIRAVLSGTEPLFTLDYPCHAPTIRRWYKLLVAPTGDRAAPEGAIVLHVDITPEKLAELEVDQRRAEAEQAVRMRDRFLAAVGHDLRQPLQAAELFLGMLRREVGSGRAGDLAAHLGQALEALRQVLDSLTDISRLESGVQPVSIQRFPLDTVLAPVAAEAEAIAREKGLMLRRVGCSATVETDPVLLGRVLRNLTGNALRYTSKGRILIGARRRQGGLEVQVLDTGIGIDPAHQEQVFKEFVQLGNAERDRRKGLGLGLSIVRRIARLLDLQVRLTSEPGRGTVVGILIPDAGRSSAGSMDDAAKAAR